MRPPAADLTPLQRADLRHREAGKLSCEVDDEASRENFEPGLPRLRSPSRPPPFSPLSCRAFLVGQPGEATRPAARLGVLEICDRPGDRHVGADAGQRLQHLGLRLVETGRERVHGDDEADADAEAERCQERAALARRSSGTCR